VSVLQELKSKPWFPWALSGGVILFFSGCFSAPHPSRFQGRIGLLRVKSKDQKEGFYDLKIGSWQNRVDQDLEATKKQLAEIDMKQQEIKDQFKRKKRGQL
jgi:hypothetical protein